MPRLVPLVFTPGALREHPQPTIAAAGDLRLRPFRLDDADAVFEGYEHDDIRYFHMRSMTSIGEARSWIDEAVRAWTAETDGTWAIVDPADAVIGRIALRGIDREDGSAELSYWVLPRARGHSAAVRAVQALTSWATNDLGLHRLRIEHVTSNERSCAVARRAGYTLEGTMRQAQRLVDGWHDVHLHAFVAGDPQPSRRTEAGRQS